MNETKSSSPQSPAQLADGLRKMSPQMLLVAMGQAWKAAAKRRDEWNANIDSIDEKSRELVRRYKEIESKLTPSQQDWLACDILDPKVKDLIIALEDGSYEKPKHATVYDYLDSEFESYIGEVLLRMNSRTPAPSLEEE